MKKLFSLLLAVALLMSASFVLAEEAGQALDPQSFPYIYFGADNITAREVFKHGWGLQYSFSDIPAWETREDPEPLTDEEFERFQKKQKRESRILTELIDFILHFFD